MIDELRASAMLKGARGRAPRDVEAAVDAMLRVSQLLLDFPKIAEIDVNPFRVFTQGHGGLALDGRVVLERRDSLDTLN